jgi:hypothetical protein
MGVREKLIGCRLISTALRIADAIVDALLHYFPMPSPSYAM